MHRCCNNAESKEKGNTQTTGDEQCVTKRKVSEKHAAKHATMVACNSTAKNLFSQSEEIKRLHEKIQILQEQLQQEKSVHNQLH